MCTLQNFYEHNTGVYTFRMIFGDLEEKLKNWTSKFVLFDTFNSARNFLSGRGGTNYSREYTPLIILMYLNLKAEKNNYEIGVKY